MTARRASTSARARAYRQEGHDNALLFALELGLGNDYQNDPHAKKDVIDPAGDAHSVKSGKKKWQMFLYSRNRFLGDVGFQGLNGIGDLLIRCIDAFPPTYAEYKSDTVGAKTRLQAPMRELRSRLQEERLLKAFLMKAVFNGGEVNYLTVMHEDKFHVFLNDDVVRTMALSFEVTNSQARRRGEFPDQKILFRFEGLNVGELEMRNDSPTHYQEVRFNMLVRPALRILFGRIPFRRNLERSNIVRIYGNAVRRFGRW